MKKKLLFGAIAAALVALNALALSSFTASASAVPGNGGCYQSMGYCGHRLTYKCLTRYTAERCRIYVCSECGGAVIVRPGIDDMLAE